MSAGEDSMFRFMVEHSPDIIVRYDLSGRRLYANPAWERLTGRAADDILGKTVLEQSDLTDPVDYHAHLMAALQGRIEAIDIEFDSVLLGRRDIHVRFVPEFDAEGRPSGVFAIGHDVTEYMEEALQKREGKLRGLYELSPLGIALTDMHGRFLEFNEAFRALCGYPAEALKALDYWALTPREYERSEAEQLASLAATGHYGPYEKEYQRQDGTRVAIRLHGMLVAGPNGQNHIWSIVENIGESKEAERRLRQALAFSEGIINAIPDLLFEVDRDGRYHNVWAQNPELLALREEALVGKTIAEVLPPEATEVCQSALREADENGNSFGKVLHLDLPDVGKSWFELSVSKRPGGDQADTRFIVISREITERKRVETLLRQRKEAFRALAENSPDPIFRYDREGRRIYVNRRVLALTEKTAERLIGATGLDGEIVSRSEAEKVQSVIRQVLESGETAECEVDVIAPDGSRHVFENRYAPEFGPDGEVTSVLAVCRDITAFKAALENLRFKEIRLAEAQRIGRMGSWELDLVDGKLTWSDEIYRLFEIAHDQFGASYEAFLNVIHPDDRVRVDRAYTESIENRMPYEIDHRLRFPDGRIKYVRERCETIYREDGVPLLSRGTVQDITEIKETQSMLEGSQAELRRLAARRDTVLEDERRHIAREMHEELGQVLVALRMKVSRLRRVMRDANPESEHLTGEMMEMTEGAVRKIRQLVASMRPTTLDMGLVPALEWLADDFDRGTAIVCRFQTPAEEPHLTDVQVTSLFRLVQEALTNVALHAEASRVDIELSREGEAYRLSIVDDGKGITSEDMRKPALGLIGMREQTKMLGGSLQIGTGAGGQGAAVHIRFPVAGNV